MSSGTNRTPHNGIGQVGKAQGGRRSQRQPPSAQGPRPKPEAATQRHPILGDAVDVAVREAHSRSKPQCIG